MASNILNILQGQAAMGLRADMVKQLYRGWQVASWEDVLVDKSSFRDG